jgi:hypothetical protein
MVTLAPQPYWANLLAPGVPFAEFWSLPFPSPSLATTLRPFIKMNVVEDNWRTKREMLKGRDVKEQSRHFLNKMDSTPKTDLVTLKTVPWRPMPMEKDSISQNLTQVGIIYS